MLHTIPFHASLLKQSLTKDRKSTNAHVLVYGAIEIHAMGEKGCIASNEKIATETGYSKQRVADVISEMAAAGWLKVIMKGGKKNTTREQIIPLIEPGIMGSEGFLPVRKGFLSARKGFLASKNIDNNIENNLEIKINKKNPETKQTQFTSMEDSGTSRIGAKAPTSLSADVENTTPTDKTKETLLAAIAIVNPIEKATESRMSLMRARLKEYTPDEILASAKALSKSEWHRQNKQMSIDNLIRPSKIGRWYNESQSPQNTERQMYM